MHGDMDASNVVLHSHPKKICDFNLCRLYNYTTKLLNISVLN